MINLEENKQILHGHSVIPAIVTDYLVGEGRADAVIRTTTLDLRVTDVGRIVAHRFPVCYLADSHLTSSP